MAEKTLGYIELEWVCPTCNTRNPGGARTCTQCGAAQPEDVEFTQAAAEPIIEDEAKVAEAAAGADVHCAYCGTRNSARRTVCSQCGADLTEARKRAAGQVVGAHRTEPLPELVCPACGAANAPTLVKCARCGAPLQKPVVPEPVKAEAAAPKRGCGILPLILLLGLAAILLFAFLSGRTTQEVGEVVGTRWQRTIEIQGLMPVTRTDWREEIPAGAEITNCRQEVYRVQDEPAPNAIEVCGTPFVVDRGSGYGEVMQNCRYQILADRCDYTDLAWRRIDMVTLSGEDLNPVWPGLNLASQQRAGTQSEELLVLFNTDGQTRQYWARSQAEFSSFQPGSRWLLEVNSLGSVVNVQPR